MIRHGAPLFFILVLSLVSTLQGQGSWEFFPGPEFRKVALNGRPLGARDPSKPVTSDAEPELSLVDALSLQLRHNTTDIYVALAGGDLALALRRNTTTDCWPAGHSAHLGILKLQRPFGHCWTTGIAPFLALIDKKGMAQQVLLSDEDGTLHRFTEVAQSGKTAWVPIPGPMSMQDVSGFSLARAGDGGWVFRRKYGLTLCFQPGHEARTPLRIHADGEVWTFHRASSASHHGVLLSWHYETGNETLIPNEISFQNIRMRIEHNTAGLITRVIGPSGFEFHYRYNHTLPGAALPVLDEVVMPPVDGVRAVTQYTYLPTRQKLPRGPEVGHVNISAIRDANGAQYQFRYEEDNRERGTAPGPALLQLPPNTLSSISLPGAFGESRFQRKLLHAPAGDKPIGWETTVVDAEGHARVYRFMDGSTTSGLTAYKRCDIAYYTGEPGKNGKVLGEEHCLFDAGAGFSLAQFVDFSGNTTRYLHGDPDNPLPGPFRTFFQQKQEPTQISYPDGTQKTIAYNPAHRKATREVDEEGRISVCDINARGQITGKAVYPNQSALDRSEPFTQELYAYGDPAFPAFVTRKTVRKLARKEGNPAWETDLVTDFLPDERGNLREQILAATTEKWRRVFDHDINNSRTAVVHPNGYTILFFYDSRQRIKKILYPSSMKFKSMTYDKRGNKLSETDSSGHTKLIAYDLLTRKIKEETRDPGAKQQKETQLTWKYNAVGSKLADYDDGLRRTNSFDGLQRLSRVTYADGSWIAYEYGDHFGNVLMDDAPMAATGFRFSNGTSVKITRDSRYRKVKLTKRDPQGVLVEDETYTYDKTGNLTRQTSMDGSVVSYEYDALNRQVLQKTGTSALRTLYTSTGLKYLEDAKDGPPKETVYDAAGDEVEPKPAK